MRAHAAHQQVVAVVHQMLRRYGGGQIVAAFAHQPCGFCGGDVLEHDFQMRDLFQHGLHNPFDEYGLAVKNINIGVGNFAVRQKQDALVGHCFQHGQQLEQIGHAAVGIGGGAGRIEFEGGNAGSFGFAHGFNGGFVGEVQAHERLEAALAFGRHGGQNLLAVGQRLGDGADGRFQVGHNECAPHLPRGEGDDRFQRVAAADVQVEIVGSDNGEGLHDVSRRLLFVSDNQSKNFVVQAAFHQGVSCVFAEGGKVFGRAGVCRPNGQNAAGFELCQCFFGAQNRQRAFQSAQIQCLGFGGIGVHGVSCRVVFMLWFSATCPSRSPIRPACR